MVDLAIFQWWKIVISNLGYSYVALFAIESDLTCGFHLKTSLTISQLRGKKKKKNPQQSNNV